MLEAVLTANVDEIKVSGLTQWDRGQMLKIVCPDLPAAFQVHFTNRARVKAIPVQAAGAADTAIIAIPDEILREPFEVLAHLYFTEGDAGLIGETVKTVRLPITSRAQPEDYVVDLTQEQQTAAERMLGDFATAAANKATQGALSSIQNALKNLPSGSTLVINYLTTGGAAAALSAEMGNLLAQRPNPQLLHNWDLTNAVNQRGLQEYTAVGYTIDRYRIITANTAVAVADTGITIRSTGSNIGVLRQVIETQNELFGQTVTISVLLSNGSFVSSTGKIPSALPEQDATVAVAALDSNGASGRYFALFVDTNGLLFVNLKVPAGGEMTVAAVKLELGNVQTLAHQDSSGKWVLNEIPDYGTELAKCQRYYQLFSSADKRPTALVDYRPAMRTTPKTGTITIDGVTRYYADANL